MHLVMMVIAVVCSYYIRTKYSTSGGSWSERWQRAIALFLFSPLLLLTTSVAVVCMGSQGHMIGFWDAWFTYALAKLAEGIALGFCCWVMVKLLISTLDANYLLEKINNYPQIDLAGLKQKLSPNVVQTSFISGKYVPHHFSEHGGMAAGVVSFIRFYFDVNAMLVNNYTLFLPFVLFKSR